MASQVPYTGAPTVAPESAPIPGRSTDAPLAAFGGAVAQATSHLGEVAQGAGSELYARSIAMQQVNEAANANKAVADFTTDLAQAYADYRTKEGSAAIAAFPDYQKQVGELREKYRTSLGSDYAQKAYDQESRSMVARTMFSAAAHAGDEAKKYDRAASTARVATSGGLVAADPTNEGHVTDAVRTIRTEVDHQFRDQSPEVRKQKADELISGTLSTQVISLAKRDPFGADTKAEAYIKAGRIVGDDVTKVRDVVLRQVQSVGSARIGQEVADKPENRDASTGDIEKQAGAAAEKARPGDADFKQLTIQRAVTVHNQKNRIDASDQFDTLQTIKEAMAVTGPGGQLPTSPEEAAKFSKNPEVLKAWDKLATTDKAKMQEVFASNAAGGYPETRESAFTYNRLSGLAIKPDPSAEDVRELINTDVMNLKMPMEQRSQLVKYQKAIFNKLKANPPITAAALRLAKEDDAIKLALKDPGYSTMFVGGLHAAWDEYVKINNKIPDAKEITQMGQTLMRNIDEPGSWYGTNPAPVFRAGLAKKDEDAIRLQIESEGKQATPNLIHNRYVGEIFNQLYSKAKAK